MANKHLQPSPALLLKVESAFLAHGYRALTMEMLAGACGFSRRALYFYFGSKSDAFRAAVRFRNELGLTMGFAAGRKRWTGGGEALDILSAVIDIRYGNTLRIVNASPHIVELNAEVYTRCIDIFEEVALYFEGELAKFIAELQGDGLVRLRQGVRAGQLARALVDGARGVNQRLPAVPPRELAGRYREMCRYVLYGGTDMPAARRRKQRRTKR
jgi:AcrR family transcriptional regulator